MVISVEAGGSQPRLTLTRSVALVAARVNPPGTLATPARPDYAYSAKKSNEIPIFDPHFSAAARAILLGQKSGIEPSQLSTFNGTAVPRWL
jgi:hypothetical protein